MVSNEVMIELARQGVQLSRFKGLGEMNAEQLRETTMDPGSRTLQRVSIDVTRPLPFTALPRPALGDLAKDLLRKRDGEE